ncbi:Glutamate decarboxylase 5 [Orobanche hederae]
MVLTTTKSDPKHLSAPHLLPDMPAHLSPVFKIPTEAMPKDAAFQIVNDELMLDGNPRLNLASFVTTWIEPECDNLIMASINKNYVDMDEYPVTAELQMLLWFQTTVSRSDPNTGLRKLVGDTYSGS